jgi:hypothetical protein
MLRAWAAPLRSFQEYRPTWEQLRVACPEWPGFRLHH